MVGDAAGFAEFAAAVVVVGVVVPAGAVMLPAAGVLADAEAGKVVSGVGSGGNGLDNTLAISSLRPASD